MEDHINLLFNDIEGEDPNPNSDPPTQEEMIALIEAKMEKYRITNPYMKNAMMGIILSEGGFKGVAENMYYTTPGRLAEVWSTFSTYKNSKGQTIRAPKGQGSKYANELAKSGKYVKNPEALGNFIYGNRMNNDQPGDGYKYRGRGLNQLTGKGAYKSLGNKLGVDLINNPDLLIQDPNLQAEVAVKFLADRINITLPRLVKKNSKYAKRFPNLDYNNYTNQEDASYLLTSANAGFGKTLKSETINKRLAQAKKFTYHLKDRPADELAINNIESIEPEINSVSPFDQWDEGMSAYDTENIEKVTVPFDQEDINYSSENYENTIGNLNDQTVNNTDEKTKKRQNKFSGEIFRRLHLPQVNFGQSIFGQGKLFGADKKKYGGTIYPRYLENGGPGDKAINYNVDAETENLKIWDPQTNSFKVSSTPYTGDTTGMVSHYSDRYLDDDMSNEARFAKMEKVNLLSKLENEKVERARQELADRTETLGEGKTSAGKNYYGGTSFDAMLPRRQANSIRNKMGCTTGSTGCFMPTKDQIAAGFQTDLTTPYFVQKSKDPNVRYQKKKTTNTPGFAEENKNMTYQPNIFANYTTPNAYQIYTGWDERNADGTLKKGFKQDKDGTVYRLSDTNKKEGDTITKRGSRGINWENEAKSAPGDPLNVIGGTLSYFGNLPKMGMKVIPEGDPAKPGDRLTQHMWNTDGTLNLTGQGGAWHNLGVGNYNNAQHTRLNLYNNPADFGSGFHPTYTKSKGLSVNNPQSGKVGLDYQGKGAALTRYIGDTDYYNYIQEEQAKNLGFKDQEKAAAWMEKEKWKQDNPISRLEVLPANRITNTTNPTTPILPYSTMKETPSKRKFFKNWKKNNRLNKNNTVQQEKGGSLGKPCSQGQIYDTTTGTCVPYYLWVNNQKTAGNDFDMREVKKENEDYFKANEWFKDYYNSPKYKEMVKSSYPSTSHLPDNIIKSRNKKLESTPPLIIAPQPKNRSTLGGQSWSHTGQIEIFPSVLGKDSGSTAHELSHSSDRPLQTGWERLIPRSDSEYINKRKPKYLGDTKRYWNNKQYYDWLKENDINAYRKIQKKEMDWTDYVGEDTETRARLNTFRQIAQEQGIYDPFTQGVSEKLYYDKIKNFKMSNSKIEGFNPIKQLQDAFSDEEIIWMLNNISKAEPKQDNNDTEGMA